MKIMHTMASDALANRPQRRFYSPELKAQVMQECRQGGASVAGVALSHGINANTHCLCRTSAIAGSGEPPCVTSVNNMYFWMG
jgi:transposase-like protein